MGTDATRLADDTMADATGEVPISDLQQEPHQFAGPVVPVTMDGPVQVQVLPATSSTSRSVTLPINGAQSIAKNDLRRSRMFLCANGNPVFVGPEQAQVNDGSAGRLPVGALLEWPGTGEVFARADGGAAGETTLSVFIHQWTS